MRLPSSSVSNLARVSNESDSATDARGAPSRSAEASRVAPTQADTSKRSTPKRLASAITKLVSSRLDRDIAQLANALHHEPRRAQDLYRELLKQAPSETGLGAGNGRTQAEVDSSKRTRFFDKLESKGITAAAVKAASIRAVGS